MSFDPWLTLACFGIGIIVGLTGMGGGALMTPVLVLFFGYLPAHRRIERPRRRRRHEARGLARPPAARHGQPRPREVAVHRVRPGGVLRRASSSGRSATPRRSRTSPRPRWAWRCSSPSAGLIIRAYIRLAQRARRPGRPDAAGVQGPAGHRRPQGADPGRGRGRWARRGDDLGRVRFAHHHHAHGALPDACGPATSSVRTSCRRCPWSPRRPLAHILFGDFNLSLTASLLIGSIPGVWVGAHLSARAPGGLVRRTLAFVLLASALKLLDVPTTSTAVVLLASLVVAPLMWMLVRRHHGFPALASRATASAR